MANFLINPYITGNSLVTGVVLSAYAYIHGSGGSSNSVVLTAPAGRNSGELIIVPLTGGDTPEFSPTPSGYTDVSSGPSTGDLLQRTASNTSADDINGTTASSSNMITAVMVSVGTLLTIVTSPSNIFNYGTGGGATTGLLEGFSGGATLTAPSAGYQLAIILGGLVSHGSGGSLTTFQMELQGTEPPGWVQHNAISFTTQQSEQARAIVCGRPIAGAGAITGTGAFHPPVRWNKTQSATGLNGFVSSVVLT